MQLPPIILIPGTGASLMEYREKSSGESGLCWIPHNLFTAWNTAQEYLMCKYNPQTKMVESFCKDYADVYPVEGKDGCAVTLQLGNQKLVKYFCDLISFLELNGYKYGHNLFAMTYDWRQDIALVAEQLKKFIHEIYQRNQQKVVILGHSLGNQVCDIYLRLDSDFNKYLKCYFAIAPPFDGTSAVVPMSYVKGYDMQQPLPLSICKQIEIRSAMMSYLGNKRNSPLMEFPCIFLRKRDDIPDDFKLKSDLIELQKKNLIRADYSDIKLDQSVYQGKRPDTAFLIAKDIYQKKALLPQYLYFDFKFLQKMCRNGAIKFSFEKDSHLIQHNLYMHLERAEKPQIRIECPGLKWHWEVYYPNETKKYNSQQWWKDSDIKGDYITLNNKIHSKGTFYGYLYNSDRELQEIANKIKAKEINFQKDSDFRVYSYIGTGVQTRMHVYYDQIINYYEEILDLKPKYTFADGDGTVLKSAAEQDGYPDWVIQRTYAKVKGHNEMLFNKEFFKWIYDRL